MGHRGDPFLRWGIPAYKFGGGERLGRGWGKFPHRGGDVKPHPPSPSLVANPRGNSHASWQKSILKCNHEAKTCQGQLKINLKPNNMNVCHLTTTPLEHLVNTLHLYIYITKYYLQYILKIQKSIVWRGHGPYMDPPMVTPSDGNSGTTPPKPKLYMHYMLFTILGLG